MRYLKMLFAILTLCRVSGAEPYYPIESDKGSVGVSEFEAEWYSKHLNAMKEPSLHSREVAGQRQYRFVWLRSFHKPVAVRVYLTPAGPRLRATRLSGKGGYEPGKIDWEKSFSITDAQWKRIETFFASEAVRNPMKPLKKEEQLALMSTDGAQWILEERRGDKYWATEVQSPQSLQKLRGRTDFDLGFEIPDFGPYIECCLYFLKLAGLREQEVY